MNTHSLIALTWGQKRAVLSLATLAASFAAATPASAETLWNQYDNSTGGGTASSVWLVEEDAVFDSEAADDFTVPSGEKWRVKEVSVDGTIGGGSDPHPFARLAVYKDKNGLPGELVHSGGGFVPPNINDFVLDTSNDPIRLKPGKTYWLSVQADLLSMVRDGTWYWTERSVQSGNPSVWRNPPNGYGTGCIEFSVRSTCGIGPAAPDQVFKLKGKAVPVL